MNGAGVNPGALNLLINCARVTPGDTVLVAVESADYGYYNEDLAPCVVAAARHLGCNVDIVQSGFDPEAREIPQIILDRAKNADVMVSLSRFGDQLRFDALPGGMRSVQCYALDAATLAGPFGTVTHEALVALRKATDRALSMATEIRITCANGTDVSGRAPPNTPPADTTCARFPLSVFSPILAQGFSGKVALPRFLTGTGARYYDPFTVALPAGVFAHFTHGRLTKFSGPDEGVRRADAHYDFVAGRYDLDRDSVHSWHAGIHPGCNFTGSIERSFEAWSGSAFGNPRILHFHTCGSVPPGEISWNVIDATIEAEGIPLWKGGVFQPTLLPGGARILDNFPDLLRVFASPERAIGL
ncbi:hypothetical protein [Sedimentitalea sp.]|uniref:hypothetical protein n=1 Tax=Sedimentitalea sp. TaxID=2048915 RepID=UPI003299699E